MSLPDNAAIRSIERVHIIRFGYGNNRRPAAWAVIQVERLRKNVADNRTVKIQVACQISCSTQRERGINVKTVPRIVVVKLGHVYLCVCRNDYAPDTNNDDGDSGRQRFHASVLKDFRRPFTMPRSLRVKPDDDSDEKT